MGTFPQVRRAFQVTRCNQCADAPCVTACPTAAMFQRPDGIVDFDKSVLHRLQGLHRRLPVRRDLHQPGRPLGREVQLLRAPARRSGSSLPAWSSARPRPSSSATSTTPARGSRRSSIATPSRCAARRRRPGPKLFYKGAHQATLDPLAARRPAGGTFMWSEQGSDGPSDPCRPATRAPGTAAPPRCSPTTCRTARPGTGGSASTPGPRASRPAPTSCRCSSLLAGLLSGRQRALGVGGARSSAAPSWP